LTIPRLPPYDVRSSHSGANSSTASRTSRMRTIEVWSRFPSLNAVWMNGPLVEIRIHNEP
jgi:hypothetical protein